MQNNKIRILLNLKEKMMPNAKQILLILLAQAAVVTMAIAQEQRVPTPGDFAGFCEVSDVRISPGGEQIAFVVTSAGEDEKPGDSDIWLVPTDGKEPARPFAISDYNEISPRWSPDGRVLAFLSTRGRDNKRQIYLLRTNGGEAEKLTRMNEGVRRFKWSQDGSMIAFTSGGLWVMGLAGRKAERASLSDMGIIDFDWSPSGDELAINSDNKLVIVRRETGEVNRTLCGSVSKSWSRRKIFDWSPDGSMFLFAELAALEVSPARIGFWMSIVPASGGDVRPLLKDYRGTITKAVWAPDSKHIIAQSFEGTASKFLRIDVKTGEVAVIADDIFQEKLFTISADGKKIAYKASSSNEPNGVWIYSEKTGKKRLTHLNPQALSLQTGDVKEIAWKNEDGQTLFGVLITPVGYRPGQRYPMIVQIHGGPHFAWWRGWLGDWHDWAQLLAANGYVVFLPNPRGSTGQGLNFSLGNVNDMANGPLKDILAGVDYLIKEGIADPERLGVGGWSYGGYLTAWTITQTDIFKAAVVGAGRSSITERSNRGWAVKQFYRNINIQERYQHLSKVSPVNYLHNVVTPTLVLHGEKDPKIHYSQGQELHDGLKELNIETELMIYTGEGHGIKNKNHQLDMLERILAWYDQYVKIRTVQKK